MNQNINLKIVGMHCSSCAMNIEGELEDTPGVESVKVNFAKEKAEVAFDPEKVNLDEIQQAVKRAGYDCQIVQ